MNKRYRLSVLRLSLLLLLPFLSFAADRPNVVFIVSEDNSIHYLKHFFPGGAKAPHIEALASHGLTFDRAYSNGAVCSVARSTLATGCLGPRIGTQFHRRYQTATLQPGTQAFTATLREAGYYATNRSKTDYNFTPAKRAWDESSGKASWRNRKTPEQPFFHMQSHADSHEGRLHFNKATFENEKTTHDPADVTLADYFPDTALFRYTHARYLDRMQIIDGIVGNTIKQLEQDGVLEDTFIFYFGDHGGVLPRGKGYIYSSGLHVPLVVRVPKNFKHLVDGTFGERVQGAVSFIDFGPTALHLAGVDVPAHMDGIPFLGKDVKMGAVNARDEAFGYADRFDEKYEFIRTLYKGKYQYIRYFQPFLPDGLQNNYRYRMLAFTEWRDLHKAGSLNGAQSQFFAAKPVEALYDTAADPHEVNNLAGKPEHAALLKQLRGKLSQRMRALPDLSFYPESHLMAQMGNPVAFGQSKKTEIAELIDIADLAFLPFAEATPKLRAALSSANPWHRYWGAMTCSMFGKDAAVLESDVEPLLKDDNETVRIRAAEFLGLIGAINPQATLVEVTNQTDNPVVGAEALNSAVYFRDAHQPSQPIDLATLKPKAKNDGVLRRIEYFTGKPMPKAPKKNTKK